MVLEAAGRAARGGVVDLVRKRTGRVPTARTWFGFVSVWTCALAAAKAKSLDATAMAKALQGFVLPPEIGLSPNLAFYRAGQNQLITTLFVGNAQPSGDDPEDLFKVTSLVNGADVAGTVEESGCKMTWPA
jgi:branched-chain amino acid transport system substrate-binding protein